MIFLIYNIFNYTNTILINLLPFVIIYLLNQLQLQIYNLVSHKKHLLLFLKFLVFLYTNIYHNFIIIII